jgi:Holliday junction resolvase RusA-like endonuclease
MRHGSQQHYGHRWRDMRELRFFVAGEPRTQGSKRGMPIYRGKHGAKVFTGKVVMMEGANQNATVKFKRWREDVRIAANNAKVEAGWVTADEPIELTLTFYLQKPQKPPFDKPATGLDVDKLIRSVGDSLKDAGVFINDSRVCDVTARKRYADHEHSTGVDIIVRRLSE